LISIVCLEYEVYKSGTDDYYISTERIDGFESDPNKNKSVNIKTVKWNEDIKAKDVIHKAVMDITKDSKEVTFSPKQIVELVVKWYPDFKKNTVGCQLIQDCVNHTS